jgi:hypothetical protein
MGGGIFGSLVCEFEAVGLILSVFPVDFPFDFTSTNFLFSLLF